MCTFGTGGSALPAYMHTNHTRTSPLPVQATAPAHHNHPMQVQTSSLLTAKHSASCLLSAAQLASKPSPRCTRMSLPWPWVCLLVMRVHRTWGSKRPVHARPGRHHLQQPLSCGAMHWMFGAAATCSKESQTHITYPAFLLEFIAQSAAWRPTGVQYVSPGGHGPSAAPPGGRKQHSRVYPPFSPYQLQPGDGCLDESTKQRHNSCCSCADNGAPVTS
jgi:hypothetical protein